MKNMHKVFAFALCLFLVSVAGAFAQEHAMGGMAVKGEMIDLGSVTQDGVEGLAEIKDIHEAMAKMGMEATHHFMVMFVDTKDFEPIEEGLVAVKIKDPSGKVSEPVKLMGMHGGFGSDITLPGKGDFVLEVGTKLKDGKKRVFEYSYTVK